jgi:hypothetical protein
MTTFRRQGTERKVRHRGHRDSGPGDRGELNFADDGQLHSILDAALLRTGLTDTLSAGQHLGAINCGGGAAGFTAQQPRSNGRQK